jgi:hypothetical protein
MTSTSIYTAIDPTYLYIKQHSITGLKYFGKTIKDPYTYNGSGKYWCNHIKVHGKEHIVTLWVSEPYTDTSIAEFALKFSAENDIVNSKKWANMMPENGLDGGSVKHTDETKSKMSEAKKGKSFSEEHKANISAAKKGKMHTDETKSKMSEAKQQMSDETKSKMSEAKKGKMHTEESKVKMRKPKSDEHKAKISAANKGKPQSEETKAKMRKPKKQITCPHCGKTGGVSVMKRWHFDNCKIK